MTGFMLYQKLNGKWRDDKMSDKYQAQLNCVFPFDKASYDFAGINEQTKHGI